MDEQSNKKDYKSDLLPNLTCEKKTNQTQIRECDSSQKCGSQPGEGPAQISH